MITKKKAISIAESTIILLLCAVTVCMDFIKPSIVGDSLRNALLLKIIQQSIGILACVLLMLKFNIKLFGKPQYLLYMLPCIVIAIDNFQWSAYFKGYMTLARKEGRDIVLFAVYCMSVGLFEECIFRGVIFSLLAAVFSQDRKGLWRTYVVSSFIFGGAHLSNGFSLGTLLQVIYTVLTGGLFAFVLLKTKNIFCCGFIHGLYNFCGMLFDTETRLGLGNGVVFDLGTVITMSIVCISMGILILYWIYRYSEEERVVLYGKLGISPKQQENKDK